jgi:alpha-tubulin suppressor-like RCC1 family protein
LSAVSLISRYVVKIAAGTYFNVILASDGTVLTWGRADYYQTCGDRAGTSTSRSAPRMVTNVIYGKMIYDIATGPSSSYLVSDNGTLYSWGKGDQYVLFHTLTT